jgi:hypothetical protein
MVVTSRQDTYGYDDNGTMSRRTVNGVISTLNWTPEHLLDSVTKDGPSGDGAVLPRSRAT